MLLTRERTIDEFIYMTCIIVLQKIATACSPSIHSLDAMSFQSSVEKGRSLLANTGSSPLLSLQETQSVSTCSRCWRHADLG